MASIKTIIYDPTGSKKTPVELPDDVPMRRLIPALVSKMGLPTSQGANPITYRLDHRSSGKRLSEDEFFSYALHFEDHGDNLAPGRLGGLVVTCVVEREDGRRSLINVKRNWPEEVKIILAIPELELETARMRAALPRSVPMSDIIFNLQRAALLQAAISERRFDLLGEALRDRLHQPFRAPLAPGLSEVLRLNDERDRHPGLLGVAISGAGSTMIAFAVENCAGIAAEMRSRLELRGVPSRALEVEVDNHGRSVEVKG